MNLPAPSAAGDAPKVDDGLALLVFRDIVLKTHTDWATERDKFGHPDNGDRYHFVFGLLNEDYTITYGEDDPEPIVLEALTRVATGEKSNFRAILSGILTPAEMALWDASTEAEPFDATVAENRIVNGKITHSKSGWPQVDSIVGIAKKQEIKAG